jgi:hypothetical protein
LAAVEKMKLAAVKTITSTGRAIFRDGNHINVPPALEFRTSTTSPTPLNSVSFGREI